MSNLCTSWKTKQVMHANLNENNSIERQTSPLVTIAIPTYNRAEFLRAAIDSALAQTYESIELIISDNASSDDTADVLASYSDYRITIVRQPENIGLIANWNACLNMAKGDYFLMLSDDDRLAPNAIQELVDGFGFEHDEKQSKEIAFVYGCCEINDRTKNITKISHSAPLNELSIEYKLGALRGERVSYPSATLFRTKDAVDVGGYSENYAAAPDIIMAFEISCLYPKVVFTGTTTTYYLFHPENYTSGIEISVLIDTISRFAKLAVLSIESSDTVLIRKVMNEGQRAQALSLMNTCVRRWKCDSISFRCLVGEIWYYRKLFYSVRCMPLLVKGLLKLISPGNK